MTKYAATPHTLSVSLSEVKLAVRIRAKNVDKTKTASGSLPDDWKGVKNMASINIAIDMNRSRVSTKGVNEQELPDLLNAFFTRFERHDFSADLLE